MLDFLGLVGFVAAFGLGAYFFLKVLTFIINLCRNIGKKSDSYPSASSAVVKPVFTYMKNDAFDMFPRCISLSNLSYRSNAILGYSILTGIPLLGLMDDDLQEFLSELNHSAEMDLHSDTDLFNLDNSSNGNSSFNDF